MNVIKPKDSSVISKNKEVTTLINEESVCLNYVFIAFLSIVTSRYLRLIKSFYVLTVQNFEVGGMIRLCLLKHDKPLVLRLISLRLRQIAVPSDYETYELGERAPMPALV